MAFVNLPCKKLNDEAWQSVDDSVHLIATWPFSLFRRYAPFLNLKWVIFLSWCFMQCYYAHAHQRLGMFITIEYAV